MSLRGGPGLEGNLLMGWGFGKRPFPLQPRNTRLSSSHHHGGSSARFPSIAAPVPCPYFRAPSARSRGATQNRAEGGCGPGVGAQPASPPILVPTPAPTLWVHRASRWEGCGLTSAMARLAFSQWAVWPEMCALFTTCRVVGLI